VLCVQVLKLYLVVSKWCASALAVYVVHLCTSVCVIIITAALESIANSTVHAKCFSNRASEKAPALMCSNSSIYHPVDVFMLYELTQESKYSVKVRKGGVL
jgi:hypothetical protein